MKTTPQTATFETVSIEQIDSGFLISVETNQSDFRHAVTSWNQLLRYLKSLEIVIESKQLKD